MTIFKKKKTGYQWKTNLRPSLKDLVVDATLDLWKDLGYKRELNYYPEARMVKPAVSLSQKIDLLLEYLELEIKIIPSLPEKYVLVSNRDNTMKKAKKDKKDD